MTYSELSFEADLNQEALSTPACAYCPRRARITKAEEGIHLPTHVPTRKQGFLVNTHEGPPVMGEKGIKSFSEIPVRATSGGEFTSIPHSSAPDFEFSRSNGRIELSVEDEEVVVPDDEKRETRNTVHIDTLAYSGAAVLNIQVRNYGDVDAYSHPTRTVVPLGSRAAQQWELIATRSQSNLKNSNTEGQSQRSVQVTEVQSEDVLLVGYGGEE